MISPATKITLSICKDNLKHSDNVVTGQHGIQCSMKNEVEKQCQYCKLQSQLIFAALLVTMTGMSFDRVQ